MPRPLVYGNGRMYIAFDDRHRARDLTWPHIGYPNHLLGHAMRVGVWVEGQFDWCDGTDWEIQMRYRWGSDQGSSVWRNWNLGMEIEVEESLDKAAPVFVRRLTVNDLRGLGRTARLFFTQNFILGQSDVGNTAFFNPFLDAVVHYRGSVYVAVRATGSGPNIEEYSTGIAGFGDREGTWRDAEDGRLEGNPIAQGSVDSTLAVSIASGETASFVMAFGSNLTDVARQLASVTGPVKDVDAGTLATSADPRGISDKAAQVYDRSFHVIQTMTDGGGAVLAATDADILRTNRATYAYCWPRDGALVSQTMARLGHSHTADGFLEFVGRVFDPSQPFLLQKYRSDGSLGASWHPWIVDGEPHVPFQEDETALTVCTMAHAAPDKVASFWESFGRPMAEAILRYRDDRGLPLPSWDPWEERFGVHFFSTCAVVQALRVAAHMAEMAGTDPDPFRRAADKMRLALDDRFWDQAEGRYIRMLGRSGPDLTADSAVVGGLLLLDDPRADRMASTLAWLVERLTVDSAIGGLARYDGDYYFRTTDKYPGNPWVISTLWASQAWTRLGQPEKALEGIEWAAGRATESGILAEQYHPDSGEPLSVSPLTWSHAEFLETVRLVAVGEQE